MVKIIKKTIKLFQKDTEELNVEDENVFLTVDIYIENDDINKE